MRSNRWLRPALTVASLIVGLIGGFILAFWLWAIGVDQDPNGEAGAVGLVWVLCLFTTPLMFAVARSVLLRVFRVPR